jgi:16S rRNA (guanine966-N2)-methyltransferase
MPDSEIMKRMTPRRRSSLSRHGGGKLRIIAGRWRGRRVPVADVPGLRPTADRVRETLFNWLAPTLDGARCLDLFAGTGALGLEALSRGAACCVFVERSRPAAQALRAACRALEATPAQAEVVEADAFDWLQRAAGEYDLVFLDPPFGAGLLERACTAVTAASLLVARGRLYLETDAGAELPVPSGWRLCREARAGQVRYGLLERG